MTNDVFSRAAQCIVEQDGGAAARIAAEALAAGIAPAESVQ